MRLAKVRECSLPKSSTGHDVPLLLFRTASLSWQEKELCYDILSYPPPNSHSPMQDKERESLEAFAQQFWSNPENVKRFQRSASEVMEEVDSSLSRGNVALMNRCITTAERSDERRRTVGLPTHDEFKKSRTVPS